MNSLLRFFGFILLSALSACTIHPQAKIKPACPVPQCTMMCAQRFETCNQLCTNNCKNCSASSTHTSRENFLKYMHEKRLMGGFVTRRLNSYRDPLQCRKVTCNCKADLMACKQGCTGVVRKGLQTVPYCT
ncbi:MAG: acyltransferase [Legionella sp.]|nr:acyltransferase [Legionella sp.]